MKDINEMNIEELKELVKALLEENENLEKSRDHYEKIAKALSK
jgi:hypothetical protein